jgi:translocation and assembly module TamB
MRALKITALVALFALVLAVATLAWLVRTESGSRWLVEQGVQLAPVTIEISGVAGTLADGLAVDSLRLVFPAAEVRAAGIVVSWSPASLLAGIVSIDNADISELSVAVLPDESAAEPVDDRLFWLQLPLLIDIESGQVGKLRIAAAEFENINLAGSIGHGRLDIENLAGQIAGASLQVNGELSGPAPGRLTAAASWDLPAAKLSGNGTFAGDIETLAVDHVLHMPEDVHLKGTIYDLLSAPTIELVASWVSIRVPGAEAVYSKAGNLSVSSDFQQARIVGNSVVALAGWPDAPLQIEAGVDLQGISIDAYVLDLLGGQVTGSGRFDYGDGIRGQLEIVAAGIDTGLVSEQLPGRLNLDARLRLESADAFAIELTAATGEVAGNTVTAAGSAGWRAGQWQTVVADITAGANTLMADLTMGEQLTGEVQAQLPDLATLLPGLQGAVNVSLQAGKKITGTLAATGLVVAKRPLGDLNMSLVGTLAEHRIRLNLAGGIIDVALRTTGGWDGNQLTERFDRGTAQPEGFDSWALTQSPALRIDGNGGELDPHCWRQDAASICLAATRWNAERQAGALAVAGFQLATLQPLLADGYSIAGAVDAEFEAVRTTGSEDEGPRLLGELHWRQSRTQLRYADEIDEFGTELNAVRIDLVTTEERTEFSASASSDEGLNFTATAQVDGPLAEGSPLTAAANGNLPSIALLRPLLQRVVNPGKLQGELTVDLDVGGSLGSPVFTGGAYLSDGELGLLGAGITLTDISIAAVSGSTGGGSTSGGSNGGGSNSSGSTDSLELTGQFRSGEGRAAIRGNVRSETDAQGKPELVAVATITGENLASVRAPDLNVDTSPNLQLRITKDVFDISGSITIPHARARVRDLPKNAVAKSEDVIVHQQDRIDADRRATIVTGDVEVILGDDVRFNGFGLDSRLQGALKLTQSRGDYLRSAGTVRVRDGFLTGYGKELRVDRGEVTFVGPLDDPLINIQVSRDSIYEGRQYTVGLRLTGSARNVKTEPFSRPAMSDNDVLAFLLLDRPTGSGADASGAAVALGLGKLVPGEGGLLGLDEVGFETNDANQAAMVAGKRINDNVYVRYVFGSLGEPGAFRIRYRLGRGFSLEASTGSAQSLDIIYLLER